MAPDRLWSKIVHAKKRAITFAEHQGIIEAEAAAARRTRDHGTAMSRTTTSAWLFTNSAGTWVSLPGIIWAPFLHGSFKHLAANTVPLLILGGFICSRNKSEFVMVVVAGSVLTGGLTWIFARNNSHVGASGLVFCFFGYLASMAYFRRTFGTLLVSVICILAYGGMLKGILPTSRPISWEGHLAGFVSGIILAWIEAKTGPTQREVEIRPVGITDALKK